VSEPRQTTVIKVILVVNFPALKHHKMLCDEFN